MSTKKEAAPDGNQVSGSEAREMPSELSDTTTNTQAAKMGPASLLQPPDLAQARKFITLLADAAGTEIEVFQALPEAPGCVAKTAMMKGALEEYGEQLQRLNTAGAGVFVTVNETDGKGRKASNITRIRALFVDLDGAPQEALHEAALEPHVIVESSPGRWHAYWVIEPVMADAESFKRYQSELAKRFGGDQSVIDLPRLMRLPGFWHRKGKPFMTRIVRESLGAPYKLADLASGLALGSPRRSSGRDDAPKTLQEGMTTDALGAVQPVKEGRHADLLILTARLARAGLSKAGIHAAVNAEQGQGRWTRQLSSDEIERAINGALKKFPPNESEADPRDYQWQKPLDLFGQREPPQLPMACVPDFIADFSTEMGELIGGDPGVIALSALTVVASCIDDRIKIRPKREDWNWKESARLWFAAIGEPSSKKSPLISAAVNPLIGLDMFYREKYQKALAKHEAEKERREKDFARHEEEMKEYQRSLAAYEKACAQYEKDMRKYEREAQKYQGEAARREREAKPVRPQEPRRPKEPEPVELPELMDQIRLHVSDITQEKLAIVLAKSAPRGILQSRDELRGFLESLDVYKNGGHVDRAAYLEAYNGGPRTVERVNRESLFVRNWSVSILGGIQPSVVQSYIKATNHDGLLQRFMLYYASPAGMGADRRPNADLIKRYETILKEIVEMSSEHHEIVLADDAHDAKQALWGRLHKLINAHPNQFLTAALGKWEGLSARLMLTMHVIEHVCRGSNPLESKVSRRTAEKTCSLIWDCLLPHAIKFYHALDPTEDKARQVARLILAQGWPRFTVKRDLDRYLSASRSWSAWEVDDAVDRLESFGWLEPDPSGRRNERRRPTAFLVNPLVHELFGPLAEQERRRRAEVVELLKGLNG